MPKWVASLTCNGCNQSWSTTNATIAIEIFAVKFDCGIILFVPSWGRVTSYLKVWRGRTPKVTAAHQLSRTVILVRTSYQLSMPHMFLCNLQFLDFTITKCILRFQFYFCHNFEAQWFSFLCGPDLYRCGGYVAEACLRIRSIRKRPLFKMWGKAKKKLSVILIAYQDFLMNELWWQNDLYKSII